MRRKPRKPHTARGSRPEGKAGQEEFQGLARRLCRHVCCLLCTWGGKERGGFVVLGGVNNAWVGEERKLVGQQKRHNIKARRRTVFFQAPCMSF